MIKSKQIALDYAKHCSKLYPQISNLFKKELLVQKIWTDIRKFSNLDLVNLKYGCLYCSKLSSVEREIDKSLKQRIFTLEIERPLNLALPFEAGKMSSSSVSPSKKDDTESTEDNSVLTEEMKLGFKPARYARSGMTSGIQDFKTNDELFNKNIKNIVEKNRIIKGQNQSHCKDFFSKWTISDETRKQLWKKRIGNKLGMTKSQYQGLELILREDGVPHKVDKVITNDLKRTFPDCKTHSEGRVMYSKMQKILRLFHIYRPEVSYIQGMTYLVSVLYYYFDEYDTFVLLANMLITNKFVFTIYTFDLTRVK